MPRDDEWPESRQRTILVQNKGATEFHARERRDAMRRTGAIRHLRGGRASWFGYC
jgi:hypothetical protein